MMRPSWIRVGTQFKDTYPYKKYPEERCREEGHVKTEAEIRIMKPHVKDA